MARGREAHVVIVGAGFAGLSAAQALGRAPVRVTVVDHHNHHLFQPLLYQVATAGLSASNIAAPIRHVLRKQENTQVILAEVQRIDLLQHRVLLADGMLTFDQLILGSGATHSYFAHPDWARVAPGLKTVEDALEIRRRILTAFERAERETDPAVQRAYLTFVVVGGGPTGVELAGALSEIARHTLARDFRRIEPEQANVLLIEAAPRVLPGYPPDLSEAACKQLERIGVHVRVGAMVTAIDEDGITIGDEHLQAKTVLWGAGVAASPLGRSLGVPTDKTGRVLVQPDLTIPGHPEVHVVGDLAMLRQVDGKQVPGLAPAAIQEGRWAAENVLRALEGKSQQPFRYRDKGSLATIGRAAAVADIRGLRLTGLAAWLTWLVVHIFFLVGFRNRVLVLLQWAWSYLTFDRGARLITETSEQWRLLGDGGARAPDASQIRSGSNGQQSQASGPQLPRPLH